MARGKLKLTGTFEEAMTRKVCYVVRSYKSKRHGKAKSVKSFKGFGPARDYANGRKNLIITKELR